MGSKESRYALSDTTSVRMSRTQSRIVFIGFLVALVTASNAVTMTADLVGDPILGSSVQVVSTWVSNATDLLLSLAVTTQGGKSYCMFIVSPAQALTTGGDFHSRLSVVFKAPPANHFAMTIRSLECSDEDTYVFTITYIRSNYETLKDSARLTLKVKDCSNKDLIAMTSMVSYDNNGLPGTNATLTCNWTSPNNLDTPDVLVVYSQNGKHYFEYNISSGFLQVNQTHDRLHVDRSLLTNASFVMSVTELRCSDEQTFVCSLHYTDDTGRGQTKTSTSDLIIKVPPSALELIGQTSTVAKVAATCKGNVGRPLKGVIEWRVYSNNNLIRSLMTSGTVVNQTAPLLSSEESCSHRIESAFNLQVNATYQHLEITCFVFNSDFQPDMNDPCINQVSSLCQSTRIMHYAPITNNLTVNGTSSILLAPGSDVIFKCRVDGDPAAMTVLVGSGLGQISQKISRDQFLELSLVNLQCEDSGRYECRGLNGLEDNSTGHTKYVDVNVTCPQKLYNQSTVPQTYRFSPDKKVVIVIDVYGFPAPTEYVLKIITGGQGVVVDGDKYSVTYVHLTPPFGRVNLTIFDDGSKSKTTYSLDIRNDFGVLEVTFDVVKEYPTDLGLPTVKERNVIIGVLSSALGALLILSILIIYMGIRIRQSRISSRMQRQSSHYNYINPGYNDSHNYGLTQTTLARSHSTA